MEKQKNDYLSDEEFALKYSRVRQTPFYVPLLFVLGAVCLRRFPWVCGVSLFFAVLSLGQMLFSNRRLKSDYREHMPRYALKDKLSRLDAAPGEPVEEAMLRESGMLGTFNDWKERFHVRGVYRNGQADISFLEIANSREMPNASRPDKPDYYRGKVFFGMWYAFAWKRDEETPVIIMEKADEQELKAAMLETVHAALGTGDTLCGDTGDQAFDEVFEVHAADRKAALRRLDGGVLRAVARAKEGLDANIRLSLRGGWLQIGTDNSRPLVEGLSFRGNTTLEEARSKTWDKWKYITDIYDALR